MLVINQIKTHKKTGGPSCNVWIGSCELIAISKIGLNRAVNFTTTVNKLPTASFPICTNVVDVVLQRTQMNFSGA